MLHIYYINVLKTIEFNIYIVFNYMIIVINYDIVTLKILCGKNIRMQNKWKGIKTLSVRIKKLKHLIFRKQSRKSLLKKNTNNFKYKIKVFYIFNNKLNITKKKKMYNHNLNNLVI